MWSRAEWLYGDNNNENVGGEDVDIQAQPNYPDFSSYFMIDKVYLFVFCY